MTTGTRFRMGHGAKQAAYLDWKVSLLENIEHCADDERQGGGIRRLHPAARAGELHDAVYHGDGKKHLSWDYLKALTPLALAVWYMDDGVLHCPVEGRPGADTGRRRAESRSASRR